MFMVIMYIFVLRMLIVRLITEFSAGSIIKNKLNFNEKVLTNFCCSSCLLLAC